MTRVEFIRQHAEQLAYLMTWGAVKLYSEEKEEDGGDPFANVKGAYLHDEVAYLSVEQSSVDSTLLESMEDSGFKLMTIRPVMTVVGRVEVTFDLSESENEL